MSPSHPYRGTPLSHEVRTAPGVSFLSLTANGGIPDVSLGPTVVRAPQRQLLRAHTPRLASLCAGDGPGLCSAQALSVANLGTLTCRPSLGWEQPG